MLLTSKTNVFNYFQYIDLEYSRKTFECRLFDIYCLLLNGDCCCVIAGRLVLTVSQLMTLARCWASLTLLLVSTCLHASLLLPTNAAASPTQLIWFNIKDMEARMLATLS